MKANSVFTHIKAPAVPYSYFDMGYDHLFTGKFGQLLPFFYQEVLPGDRWRVTSEIMTRMAPMLAPVYGQFDVITEYYFVPYRLLWEGWEEFILSGANGSSAYPAFPVFINKPIEKGSFGDYLPMPLTDQLDKFSALPYAANNKIWNDHYRDQNLQAEKEYALVDGNNEASWADMHELNRRAWPHDYFTSDLPFAQKGDAVTLPIGTFSDVPITYTNNIQDKWEVANGDPSVTGDATFLAGPGSSSTLNNANADGMNVDNSANLLAMTSTLTAEAVTINNMRKAIVLQQFQELGAIGGTRYTEAIRAWYGVESSDARLQRSEYIGGGKGLIHISEVLQTSETAETPQGNMAGHGIGTGRHHASYGAEEYGLILGFISVRPKPLYSQGLHKSLYRFDPLEYGIPLFAPLGMQEVLNREIYYSDADDPEVNDGTFGFVRRFAEYMYSPDRVSGDFRDSMAYWTMQRKFAARPALNQSFIECNPTNDIFADTSDTDKLWFFVRHKAGVTRALPRNPYPGLSRI